MAVPEQPDLFGFSPSPAKKEEMVTLTLISQGDAGENCLKFAQTEDGETFLLPISQITVFNSGPMQTTHRVGYPKYPYVQVTMPIWLAKDRGLI